MLGAGAFASDSESASFSLAGKNAVDIISDSETRAVQFNPAVERVKGNLRKPADYAETISSSTQSTRDSGILAEQYDPSVERAIGDLGKPADYDQTILDFRQVISNFDDFIDQYDPAFDWRDSGNVTPADDQGDCGNCWAFASVGALESKILIGGGSQYDLSEQQVNSCNTYGYSCCGGSMTALQFWYSQGPMEESCTGYGDYTTTCPPDTTNVTCSSMDACAKLDYNTTGYYTVDMGNNDNIKASLLTDGPTYFRYDFYSDFSTHWSSAPSGAVYTQTSGTDLGGHAVLIIGWDDSKGAWLCKNSWGPSGGPDSDGTFWIAYSGHTNNLNFGMANVQITGGTALIESFASPSTATLGLDYDAQRGGVWVAAEDGNIYLVDVDSPHSVLTTINLVGIAIASDGNSDGVCVLSNGNLLLADYNGDLSVIDDYLFEIDPDTQTLVNYWPVDGAMNTSTDGTNIDVVIGVEIGSNGHAFVTSYGDNNVYEIALVPGNPGTWSTVAVHTATTVIDAWGIDRIDCPQFSGWLVSDFSSTNVAFLDDTFATTSSFAAAHDSNSYNTGVTAISTLDGEAMHVWTTDFGTNFIGVFDSGVICGGGADCNLINDGSFENGPPPASAWTMWADPPDCNGLWILDPSPYIAPAYDGTYAYWAGGYCGELPSSDYVEQSISIPADATNLKFMTLLNRTNADDPPDSDWFYVKVNGTPIYTQEMIQANNTYPNWVERTLDISTYAGQTVTLRFEASSAGDLIGNVLVDYVRICTTTVTKDELAVDFKTLGIYVYNAGIWNRIYKGIDPEKLCSFGTYLAVDFGITYGLYIYDAGAWTRVYKGVAIEKMAGFGEKLAIDFGTAYPIYEYNYTADTWTSIYKYSSPRDTIEALGDKLVVDFKTAGIYVYDAGIWNRIYKGIDPVNIVSFGDKLAVDFGSAHGLYVYEYDTDNWTKIYKGVAIEKMAEIDGDLVVDFGTAHGLYVYEFDADNWTRIYKGVAIEKMAGFDGNLAIDFGTTYPIYEYNFGTDNWNSIYQYSSPRDELVPANIF